MENEIIDLTNSPRSSPRADPRPTSTQTTQQLRPKLTIHKPSTSGVRSTPEKLVRQNLDEGQLVNINQRQNPRIQNNTGMPGQGSATGSSNGRRRPGGGSDERTWTVARPTDHWTYRENQRFLLGIIKYGKAKFEKISEEFVPTKTPAQVAKHAEVFSNTCWYTYNVDPRPSPPPPIIANNPAISADIDMTTKTPAILQLEASAVPRPAPAVPFTGPQTPEAPPLETLRLFPVEVPFFPVTVEERIARRRTRPTTRPVNLRALALEPEPISLGLALPNFINVPDDDENGEGWV